MFLLDYPESLTQLITVCMSSLKNRDQLAQEYGVSRPTFYRMLERAGIALPARVQLSPAELDMVYEKLGRPPQENKNNRGAKGGVELEGHFDQNYKAHLTAKWGVFL
jgi:hypothetical protein